MAGNRIPNAPLNGTTKHKMKPVRKTRRAQTTAESLLALALLLIAALGAWKLYAPQIRDTTGAMFDFFTGKPGPPPGNRG